jgi:adenylate cyclase
MLIALPLLLLAGLLAMRHYDPGGVLERLRLAVFDQYQRLSPRAYEPTAVRIVDIDDESLEHLKMQWPWPRTQVARLIKNLTEAGAAAIAFDIVFAEPDRTSPKEIARLWSGTHDLGLLASRLEELTDHDQLFGQAIKDSGRVVTGFSSTNEIGRAHV